DHGGRVRPHLDPRLLPLLPGHPLRGAELPRRRHRPPDLRARAVRLAARRDGPPLAPGAAGGVGGHWRGRPPGPLPRGPDARGDRLRLRADRPRQGAARGCRALPARAAQRPAAVRDDAGAPAAGPDRRERDLRDDLRLAGDRSAGVRGDPGPRLPGGDRAQLHRGRADGDGDLRLRHPLHGGRPADPAVTTSSLEASSPSRLAWRSFLKNRAAVIGMVVVATFFLAALVGLALTKGQHPVLDPREVRLPDKLKPPFATPNRESVPAARLPLLGRYGLGTDELGRDVFARMLEGGFVSLSVGFVAVGIAVAVGLVLGGVAGHYGRVRIALGPLRLLTVDTLITGLIDVMLSF